MNSDQFDKFIKKVLEGLNEPYDESTWNSLEDKIESTDSSAIEDGHFDGIISEKLNKIEPAYEESHWALMEQAIENDLNQPELEDVYLDGVTYENLSNLKSPYNPAHWEIMSEKLDEAFSLRRKLVRYKVAEVALLLLLLFTVGQFIPLEKNNSTILPENEIAQTQLSPESEIVKADEVTSPTASDASLAIVEIDKAISNNPTQASTTGNPTVSVSSNTLISEEFNVSAPTPTVGQEYQESEVSQESERIEGSEESEMSGNSEESAAYVGVNAPSGINNNGIETINRAIAFNALPGSELSLLEEKPYDLPVILPKSETVKSNPFRLGIFGLADLNFVHTGYDATFAKAPYGRYASGYGGGISISKRIGNFEIETGAIYASIYYRPDTVNVIYNRGSLAQGGYVGEGFYASQIDFIKIPINVRHDFLEWNDGMWRAYALAGLSINLSIQKSYFSRQYIISERNNLRDVQPELLAEGESYFNDISYPGLFETNGIFQGNHFFTANAGLGLERLLNPRWSVFAQPMYQHQFTTAKLAGPNDDRFKTLSLLFGTKVTFK